MITGSFNFADIFDSLHTTHDTLTPSVLKCGHTFSLVT